MSTAETNPFNSNIAHIVNAKRKLAEIHEEETSYEHITQYTDDLIEFLETEKKAILKTYKQNELQFSPPLSISKDSDSQEIVFKKGTETVTLDWDSEWSFFLCEVEPQQDKFNRMYHYTSTLAKRDGRFAMEWPAPEFDKKEIIIKNPNNSLLNSLIHSSETQTEKRIYIPRSRLSKLIIEMYCGNQYAPHELEAFFNLIGKDNVFTSYVNSISDN